jgi:hypothetical protein
MTLALVNPLSMWEPMTGRAHFEAARTATEQAGGRTVIDSLFHKHVGLSPDYLGRCRAAVVEADVVVYSHPWLFPATRDLLDRNRQLVVYDAQNIEGKLRTALLDDNGGFGTGIAREVFPAFTASTRHGSA